MYAQKGKWHELDLNSHQSHCMVGGPWVSVPRLGANHLGHGTLHGMVSSAVRHRSGGWELSLKRKTTNDITVLVSGNGWEGTCT